MEVKFIKSFVREAAALPQVLDSVGVPFESINHVNWPDEYPYRPEVKFRLGYSPNGLLVHYLVTEDSVRARYGQDNGHVWTDSCVEFFCQFEAGDIYYNIETNCIGTVLLGAGKGRENRELGDADSVGSIQRWASLGRKPFEEREGQVTWELALIIPFTAFFKHRLRSFEGKTVRANFYKCGDELKQPHFLSWNPIELPKPDFHCPKFFGLLDFEG